MASSVIPNRLPETTVTPINAGQTSGAVQLVRCGKFRQLLFDDAVVNDNGYFNIPQFSYDESPAIPATNCLRVDDTHVFLIWIRANGTFGYSTYPAGTRVNGALTWVTK